MQKSVQLTVVLIGAAIFNILFWGEKQGLNVLLFDLFTLLILLKFNNESFQQHSVKALTVGTLISALLIILHNSLIVKIIHILSLFTLIGMVQCSELRFLGYACLMYLSNCFAVPRSFVKSLQDLPLLRGSKKAAEQFQNMRLSLIIVPVFFLIYFIANPKFGS